MQRQARRAVFIAVPLFESDKKATKLNRARIFTESQVCFSCTTHGGKGFNMFQKMKSSKANNLQQTIILNRYLHRQALNIVN
jgi:hypothetical protein